MPTTDEFHVKIVKYLNPPSSEDDYLRSLATRVPNSGQWVFAHHSFEDWRASKNSILWIHGTRKFALI
jgi:hypothetical protein